MPSHGCGVDLAQASEQFPLSFLSSVFIYCVWMCCLHVYLHHMHVPGAQKSQDSTGGPRASCGFLGTELMSS